MTYNATNPILHQSVLDNHLTEWRLEEGVSLRRLYITPEIATVLQNTENAIYNFRELRNVIRSFLAGYFVTVSLKGADKTKADFKRLAGLDEIWALCSRKPKSEQYRILGRFADRDIFVGLALYHRVELGDRSNYHSIAKKIGSDWDRILPNLTSVSSQEVKSYFGGVYRDVDEF